MRRSHGFTLIELMITLAVMAVLVTLAAPSFNSYIANQRVKAAAYDLLATLSLARSEAVKRNTDVSVSAASNWSTGWSVSVGGTTLKVYEPESQVAVSESNSLTSLTYQRHGRLTGATSPDFSICDPDGSANVDKRVIEIDLTGRPNLKRDGKCDV